MTACYLEEAMPEPDEISENTEPSSTQEEVEDKE
jgi:hypothetical protein